MTDHKFDQAGQCAEAAIEIQSFFRWEVTKICYTPQVPEEKDRQPSGFQNSIAAMTDTKLWEGEYTTIKWQVKVTELRGLSPVRPVVLVKKGFTVPPESFLQL